MVRILPLLALAIAATGYAGSAMAQTRSDDLTAAMVYNFARFASWSPSRFATPETPVVLCVTPGADGAQQLSALEGRPVGARRLQVRVTATPGPACHMAFLGEGAAGRAGPLNQQGVLTVGEGTDFSRTGAIGLITIGRQTRFEINTRASQAAGVTLSSQLLRLAVSVK